MGSTATQGLLSIVLNQNEVPLNPTLQKYKEISQNLDPKVFF